MGKMIGSPSTHKLEYQFGYRLRYLVAIFALILLAINGCDAVYFDSEESLQRLHQSQNLEIRVLTVRNPLIYKKDEKGHASGIDHDLILDFARHFGIKLRFIEKKDEAQLYQALAMNEGDVAAARLRGDNATLDGFIVGPAYEETQLSLFCQTKIKVKGVLDLNQRSVGLLEKDNDLIIENRLRLFSPKIKLAKIVNANSHQVLKLTSKGQFDCAFAEDLEGSYFLRSFPNVYRVGAVTSKYSLNWILRPEQQDLQALMNQWFQQASRQDDIMRIQDRYRTFIPALSIQDVMRFTSRIRDVFPNYASSFKAAARHYHIDWRLLGAVAFQESHWEAEALSYTGVRGIMQLTEGTAELAGVEDRSNPHQSIWGGAFYLKYLWERLPSDMSFNDRLSLTLASYNMGWGHLLDAQKLVLKRGRDPNSWRDIKAVLPLLGDPNYLNELEFGLARPKETLDFVERVRGYYTLWKDLDS